MKTIIKLLKALDNKYAAAAVIALMGITLVTVAADTNEADIAISKLEDIKMEQEYLKESNDKLRSERDAYFKSYENTQKEILANKDKWNQLQGRSYEIIETLERLRGLTQQ